MGEQRFMKHTLYLQRRHVTCRAVEKPDSTESETFNKHASDPPQIHPSNEMPVKFFFRIKAGCAFAT